MVFSASAVTSSQRFDNPYLFFRKQAEWAVISFVLMLGAMKWDYHKLEKLSRIILIGVILTLVIVLLPGMGVAAKGATRQLGVGFLSFTPSEFSKLGLVIFLASYLSANIQKVSHFFEGFVPPVLVAGVIAGLVMLQPDLGTTAVIAGCLVVMLFIAGAKIPHVASLMILGAAGAWAAIALTPFRAARMLAFLNPWKYANEAGFQIIQSLYALGSGGLFGVGLGRSRQKFFWLPEQHTDFIFAILGEELGYIGVLLVLTLLFILAWRGYRIALKAQDTFGSLLAAGLTTMIVVQALINIGVVSGSLPVTGIPLPFISYGGSSLALCMLSVGILLSISRSASQK
jgi:cell division protein FtsW